MRTAPLAILLLLLGCNETGTTPPPEVDWPPSAVVHTNVYGILSADCATDEDCAMVLGYHHARDRWVQMDLRRRLSTGRLTGIVDKEIIEALDLLDPLVDLAASNRALSSTRTGQPADQFVLEQATSAKSNALLEAYAVGVNQWLDDVRNARNGAQWPREFESGFLDYPPDKAADWTPADSLAAVLTLIENLTNDEQLQVVAADVRADIADDVRFADLWSNEPLLKSSVLQPGAFQSPPSTAVKRTERRATILARARPAFSSLHERIDRRRQLRPLSLGIGLARQEIGSNNWALGASRSATGRALFSNDSHLGHAQPSVWYIAHLDAKTNGSGQIHVAGLTFAGLPWVVLGQNENLAWGATNTNFDFSDVYVEQLVLDQNGDASGVMFKGSPVDFIRVPTTFTFNDGSEVERELLFVPHHGPVRQIDVDNNIAITLRWTGSDVSTDVNTLTELAVATTVQEAQTALRNVTTIGQNWVVMDNTGSFGWFPYNRIPKRPWATGLEGPAPPWLPLDGTGDFEWEGYFEYGELPQVLNAATNFIATANNDFTGALSDGDPTNDGHPPLQTNVAVGFRHARIVELIEATAVHDTNSMHTIVNDVHSSIGEQMVPAILDLADDPGVVLTPEAQKIVGALRSWNLDCPTGLDGTDAEAAPLTSDEMQLTASSGCSAFHVTLRQFENLIANDESSPGFPNFVTYFSIVDPSRLQAGDVYWDNVSTTELTETKQQIVGQALDQAGSFLMTELGDDATKWAWGRLHAMSLQSDLSGLSATFAAFNNPPPGESLFAKAGGLYTVDVANPAGDYTVSAGASMRFVCEGSMPVSCTVQLPGGQSSHVNSDNYEDLLPLWLANEPIEMTFDLATAAAEAVETVDYN